jgi:hypothetical protein
MRLSWITAAVFAFNPLIACAVIPTIAATHPAATQPSIMDILAEAGNDAVLFNENVLTKLPLDREQAESIKRVIDSLVERQSDLRIKHLAAFLAIANIHAEFNAAGFGADQEMFQHKMERYRDVLIANLELLRNARVQITAVLNPAQRLNWASLGIRAQLDARHLNRVQLSADQEKKLSPICDAAGRKMLALSNACGAEAMIDIIDSAIEASRKNVLSDDQRKTLGFPWMSLEETFKIPEKK